MKPLKLTLLSLLFASATVSVAQNPANYRPAVYPQQQKSVGTAALTESTADGTTEYLFRNDVLDAKFVKKDGKLTFGGSTTMDLLAGTELFTVKFGTGGSKTVKASEMTLTNVEIVDLEANPSAIKGAEHFGGKQLKATFTYKYSTSNVTITWTADLRDGSHYIKTNVELSADKNVRMFAVIPMQYDVDVAASGKAAPAPVGDNRLRGRVVSNGKIFALLDTPTAINTAGEGTQGEVVPIQGLWSRDTTLEKGNTWNVGSAVGLVAAEEDRRSVLAYLERERAVPWRPFPIYNSWYELNIDRTNKKSYDTDNLKVEQTVDVLQQWKKNMFDTQGVSIKAFVWDDGWDKYGTWGFNAGFPHGFSEPDVVARQMCSGQGAWLGPCGGYDTAGTQRRNYWAGNGGCNLHNPKYYEVFYNACKRLCDDYEFRYFKFDGISELSPAYGPAAGTNGEEDAEGIINIEREIRKFKPEIFFNTTVGTWASTAWLNISDAVWRHHNDHGYAGTNSNSREKWITYRDQYIYQHYVVENPLMTINSMMSHGFMLSNYGGPNNMPKDYASVLRELRCAFACGSGQVELYADYKLMNEINGGKLWEDMANLIKWQRKNADVLPDTHWVGGDPAKEQIYGWAAWNGNKAVLSLRNGKAASQKITFTLREALNIPKSVNTTITLRKPFSDQKALNGLTEGQPIDIDTPLTLTLPGSSVYMFDGLDDNGTLVLVSDLHFEQGEVHIPAGRAKAPAYVVAPLDASDKTLEWSSDDESIATVNDGAITGVAPGETTVTAEAVDGSGLTMKIKVIVDINLQNDLEQLIEEAQNTYDANEAVEYGDDLITKASQFSSPFSQNDLYPGKLDGGNLKDGVLIDQNPDTFWHSAWSGGDQKAHSHYLQVALGEEIDGNVLLTFTRRNAANDQVTRFDVETSLDGQDFSHSAYIDLTNTSQGATETKNFFLEQKALHLRFWADATTSNRGYWHCAEFQLNKATRESLNSEHRAEAEALLAALTDARKVTEATQEEIDVLAAAYKAYLEALGNTPDAVGSAIFNRESSNRKCYDLQGRTVRFLTKGVYLVNGKKVMR